MTIAMMFRTSTGRIVRRRLGSAVALAALVVGVASCGGGGGSSTVAGAPVNLIHSNPANGKTTITVGSKNFSEEFILAEVYAQALRAAGYNVKTRLNLGSEKVALKAVKDGQVSGYPEYTSTALGSFFHVPSSQIPSNATQAYKRGEGGPCQGRDRGVSTDAVCRLERRRQSGEHGAQAWLEGHLRPDGQVAEPGSRRFP